LRTRNGNQKGGGENVPAEGNCSVKEGSRAFRKVGEPLQDLPKRYKLLTMGKSVRGLNEPFLGGLEREVGVWKKKKQGESKLLTEKSWARLALYSTRGEEKKKRNRRRIGGIKKSHGIDCDQCGGSVRTWGKEAIAADRSY